ncbi:hypothetical protein QWJ34_02990 [Saccharibacillus sp. CPCC 101409]|uniref:hypothetical protein n=1 Tax=Saccharibacillus sp. CPCC 101409 TaxID=3058041 RepID=UPI00267263D9|nr:hypothetical protein [Saccharibacillus sp. CPCC 101409]MDO3408725.1 hypothetical protein [Saccharibacillus sp. CPCC 101409]
MLTVEKRSRQIVGKMAAQAAARELLPSGLWFHDDIRNNFYYASYLHAAASDPEIRVRFDRDEAKTAAAAVLGRVLELQDRREGSGTYGHWPLGLGEDPRAAEPHPLPVELMGSLMLYFFERCGESLPQELQAAFEAALKAVYDSRFYDRPLKEYGHHEAKYTAAKLLFGAFYGDGELLEDGRRSLKALLERLNARGMHEYGSQPWFWHWVQAFTCARLLLDDAEVTEDLNAILDFLWRERSLHYLGGAWAGPHARALASDSPKDRNVAFDYLQFGDFRLPKELVRAEYAGFLYYEAPEEARIAAMDRFVPAEVKKTILKPDGNGGGRTLHSYAYLTDSYAAGGMWERSEEFDNEQHRWDVTLPLTPELGDSVSQAYFFHPGQGYAAGDPRHESRYAEILPDRGVVLALYPVPENEDSSIVGVLPKGEWIREERALFGLAGGVYLAVYLRHPYEAEEAEDRLNVRSAGELGGVVIEAAGPEEAESLDADDLESFAELMRGRAPVFAADGRGVGYRSLQSRRLELTLSEEGAAEAKIDGQAPDFKEYGL